jgi:hypothetical protein
MLKEYVDEQASDEELVWRAGIPSFEEGRSG